MPESWTNWLHVLGDGGIITITVCVGYGIGKFILWLLEW